MQTVDFKFVFLLVINATKQKTLAAGNKTD